MTDQLSNTLKHCVPLISSPPKQSKSIWILVPTCFGPQIVCVVYALHSHSVIFICSRSQTRSLRHRMGQYLHWTSSETRLQMNENADPYLFDVAI